MATRQVAGVILLAAAGVDTTGGRRYYMGSRAPDGLATAVNRVNEETEAT